MSKLFLKKKILYFLIVLIIFSADRMSKIYILSILENLGTVNININSYINFILVWNKGVGFGLFSFEQSTIYNLITLIIILISLMIIYFIIKTKDYRKYFFLIILGGSLGNLFDRIYYSAVPDFINLHYNDFHWFIFNVADIFVSFGIICLIFDEIFFNNRKSQND